MQEIERKFLVTSTIFKQQARKVTRITQGYLSVDPERTVRVRVRDSNGFLTIKGKSNRSGLTRIEVEEPIGIDKAEILLTLCLPGIIDKTRYRVKVGEHFWDVDDFHGLNEGLILAEIELDSEGETFEKPAWLGKEMTGNNRYYNSQLSSNPYTEWNK